MSPAFELMPSPVGELLIVGDEHGLQRLHMQDGPGRVAIDARWRRAAGELDDTCSQLDEYFTGERAGFDLTLAPRGTRWQQRVWRSVGEIPYGETFSYGRLAERLGRPTAARAVGSANATNPISIVTPCHRIVGGDGTLTGYGGGIERKRALLEMEAGPRPTQRLYRLLDADRQPYGSALPGDLGGHRGNRIYGRLDCRGAASWIARGHYVKQRVFFSNEQAAIAAGFRPCAGCMPERYREWTTGPGKQRRFSP